MTRSYYSILEYKLNAAAWKLDEAYDQLFDPAMNNFRLIWKMTSYKMQAYLVNQ